MDHGGFIDLRLNNQEGQGNDSFWPSFTDIMTVIVMIFLIAMVVLLMRNVELVKELRATMDAEEVAAALALATIIEKDKVDANLGTAEEKISMLQLNLMQLREAAVSREAKITEQLKNNRLLATENYELLQKNNQADLTLERLRSNLKTKQNALKTAQQYNLEISTQLDQAAINRQRLESSLESDQNSLRAAQQYNLQLSQQLALEKSQNAETAQTLSQYQQTISEQNSTLSELRSKELAIENKYLVLVGEHDKLSTEYNKLIRPARSTKGRFLVEVRYSKIKGKPWVRWRKGIEGDYTDVTHQQLDEVLTRLKSEQANGLYIKIIIPENSGLSYSEAWKFTTKLHKAHDYYYATE